MIAKIIKNKKHIINSGVSLTELMIAFAIFVCAVVPFVNILRMSGQANVKSIGAIKASTLALSQLEQLKHGSAVIEIPNISKVVYSGYYALQWMIITASPGGDGSSWAEYKKTIERGKIAGYPEHQIDIAVSFYPVKVFVKKSFPPVVYDTSKPLPPQANPKEKPEYEKMTARIQIEVSVKWIEKGDKSNKEHEFKAFTIVTKP